MTCWLAQKFSKKGKFIKIDNFDDIWQVEKIYGCKEEKELLRRSNDYKNQRKVSDI